MDILVIAAFVATPLLIPQWLALIASSWWAVPYWAASWWLGGAAGDCLYGDDEE